MAYHKARPKANRDPNQPYSAVMLGGRFVTPHAEIDDKPILGGLHNAIVEGQKKTPEEEKELVKQYHEGREAVKKANQAAFDPKTGKPKVTTVNYAEVPQGGERGAPDVGTEASPEEVKKTLEAEKKQDHEGVKQPDTVAAKKETK